MRLKNRIKRLEERRGLREEKHQHEWGVPSEEIHRQFLLLVLERIVEIAEKQGEPAQELRKLRDEYTSLGVEEQIVRHDEFEQKVIQLAPKALKALFEEFDKELARMATHN